ncbi:tetratricopeptide repeat protein [uncultured Desulfuromonas sp.]|uniref:tetratricopeptide repeat protein n=1 Tax=uncultured Desulfuromonas sp. TaxID=181013 RepID=UPI002611339B|nr:tetratricopeptide repeat protein [uncultured Desulfuromonas sp.]
MGRTFVGGLLLLLVCLTAGCGGAKKAQKKVNDAEVHYILGVSYLQEGNPTLALKEFLQGERIEPGDAKLQAALGQAYHRKKAYAEAETHFQRALQLAGDDPQMQNNLGALYLDMERWDDAIVEFRRAAGNLLFLSPEVAYTGAGFAHFNKGEFQEAATAYREALDHRPTYPQAHFRLGEAYFALDRAEEAVGEFLQALDLAPNYTLAHYKLGITYLKLNRPKQARASFREVIRLAPASEAGRSAADYLKIIQ